MNRAQFPAYQSAEIAARWGCLSCTQPLNPDTLTDAQYPPGRGQYRMQCAACGLYTFFDLLPPAEA